MKRLLALCAALLSLTSLSAQPAKEVRLTLLETSDVHGNYLPYDFIGGHAGVGSLARVATLVDSLRAVRGDSSVVLLDNGDILQGQPTAYYYNYIDTRSPHLCAEALNYLRYDAATIGNHDVETGHAVYDRWIGQCRFPMLGANIIATATGKPYLKPYTLIERQGVKIAVLGMLTPGVPQWLPENLWSGLRFDDMVAIARRYMPEMRRQADVVVGLFHSGVGRDDEQTPGAENASVAVARQVPGFDVVFCGHDHRRALRKVVNVKGDSVLVANPANNAEAVALADLTLTREGGRWRVADVKGRIAEVDGLRPSQKFCDRFRAQGDSVRAFTNRVIGVSEDTMSVLPAFFGPSAFIDFIHQMQLSISGADISFSAPLSNDAVIPAGEIRVRDMFNLYKYENLLYVMDLTGQEVKDYLEYSYALWTAQMKSPADHLLRFRPNPERIPTVWQRLEKPSYNFDSAAGLRYTVDVTKPAGQKVTVSAMADGRPFSLTAHYKCALSSYRGNGGGGLLTEGAGIPHDELTKRIVWSTDKDLRYYLMVGIEQLGTIDPAPLNQWRFVPDAWAQEAAKRDVKLLK